MGAADAAGSVITQGVGVSPQNRSEATNHGPRGPGTADNWTGRAGLAARISEHLQYTAVAVLAAVIIAVPIGMLIGHTGRGTFIVVTGVNALRALPTLGVQYGDFARWQHQWFRGRRLEAQLEYWKQRLAGVAPLELPTDRPRPPVATANADA